MLSTVALRAGELLAAALIAAAALLAVTLAAAVWLRRRVKRGLEALRLVMADHMRGAAAGAAGAGRRWLWSRPVPDRRWRAAIAARRRLWRAVGAAERAVAAAHDAGAPTGELDALCRRLRQAAVDADRSLAVQRHATVAGGGMEPVSCQVTDLVAVAGQIQSAASAALASLSRPATSALTDDVHREAVALAAGIASAARAAAPSGMPGGPA
jgi:hypothetical protein